MRRWIDDELFGEYPDGPEEGEIENPEESEEQPPEQSPDIPDVAWKEDLERIEDPIQRENAIYLAKHLLDAKEEMPARHDREQTPDLERQLEYDHRIPPLESEARAAALPPEPEPLLEDIGEPQPEIVETHDDPWEHEAAVRDWIAEIGPNGAAEQILELSQQDRISPEDYDRIVDLIHEARHGEDEEPDPAE
ncbi:MAG: hypothetical protein KKA46_15030 [Proteobacteria bacterium]|nr:hypothetical protein [Pseudomonadota bacterium]